MLAGDLEQPADAVHVLGGERQIEPQPVAQQLVQIHRGGPLLRRRRLAVRPRGDAPPQGRRRGKRYRGENGDGE